MYIKILFDKYYRYKKFPLCLYIDVRIICFLIEVLIDEKLKKYYYKSKNRKKFKNIFY